MHLLRREQVISDISCGYSTFTIFFDITKEINDSNLMLFCEDLLQMLAHQAYELIALHSRPRDLVSLSVCNESQLPPITGYWLASQFTFTIANCPNLTIDKEPIKMILTRVRVPRQKEIRLER
jgi:hypothetical protein